MHHSNGSSDAKFGRASPHERERMASIAWAAKIAMLRALQVPTTAVSMSYSSCVEDEPLHKLIRWGSRSSRPA
jgi:hypothetical protein